MTNIILKEHLSISDVFIGEYLGYYAVFPVDEIVVFFKFLFLTYNY